VAFLDGIEEREAWTEGMERRHGQGMHGVPSVDNASLHAVQFLNNFLKRGHIAEDIY
jgi:hypothetical protein